MSRRIFSYRDQDDDDNNDDVSFKAALPVSKSEPELVNGQPVSGEDYLLLVRQQSKQCKQTITAPPPKVISAISLPSKFRFFDTQQSASCAVLPDPAWQEGFAESFKSYQKHLQETKRSVTTKVSLPTDKAGWHAFLYENDGKEPDSEELNVIARLSQPNIIALLRYHVEWFTNLSKAEALWIYALLLYLDPVMTAEHISILRDLARKCIKARNEKKDHDDHVFRLNMIITIIAKVFGQIDLINPGF
ncbi:survival motor neuron interacting protein 1-domain-containing protein [Dichotomocladium elegans]|nr:survival motor neuron interacting protein 1-domain-containing protein [Dichotomocladium elegans]